MRCRVLRFRDSWTIGFRDVGFGCQAVEALNPKP